MDFIKKHYEKILLGIVLLGMVVGLLFLPLLIEHDREQMEEASRSIIGRAAKPLPPLDLSQEDTALKRVQSPYVLDLETSNRVFNPVQWRRDANGRLFPIRNGTEVGPGAVVVTKITPLYLKISLESVQTNELTPHYVITVERQAARYRWQQRPQAHLVAKGEKNEEFALRDVQGPPQNPTQLTLQLRDGAVVTLSPGKPYQRVEDYSADLKYDPEGGKWSGVREGANLKFNNDDYIVVAIHDNEVILSAQSNQKKWTLPYQP